MLDDHHDQPPLARGVNDGLTFLLQEIMGKAVRMISHAGQMVVGLGCNDEAFAVLRMSRKDHRCNRVVILSRPTG